MLSMPPDEDAIRQALEAQASWEELQRRGDEARTRFHEAVLELHESGATLREIAAALHLSHQRVHQIVEGRGGIWSRLGIRRRANAPRSARCSFCGTGYFAARRLIAGPGVWICDGCVRLAEGTARGSAPPAGSPARLEVAGRDSGARCRFCGRAAHQVAHVVTGPGAAICDGCLTICDEILTEAGLGV
jgi:hypothetical protein